MPRSLVTAMAGLVLAAGCSDLPTVPVDHTVAALRATEPPPPPIFGSSSDGSQEPPPPPPPPTCAGGWFAEHFRYSYLRNPAERLALLSILDGRPFNVATVTVSPNARIISTPFGTMGVGYIAIRYPDVPNDAEVFIDLTTDVAGTVLQPPGVEEFAVAVWARVTEPAGTVCRVLGHLPVVLHTAS